MRGVRPFTAEGSQARGRRVGDDDMGATGGKCEGGGRKVFGASYSLCECRHGTRSSHGLRGRGDATTWGGHAGPGQDEAATDVDMDGRLVLFCGSPQPPDVRPSALPAPGRISDGHRRRPQWGHTSQALTARVPQPTACGVTSKRCAPIRSASSCCSTLRCSPSHPRVSVAGSGPR